MEKDSIEIDGITFKVTGEKFPDVIPPGTLNPLPVIDAQMDFIMRMIKR